MFVSKKDNTKSFTRAKVYEDITEDNIEEMFIEGNEVYRLVKVNKDVALEAQKQKEIEELRQQQYEIAKRLEKLNSQPAPPESEVSQVEPPKDYSFVSEEEKNKALVDAGQEVVVTTTNNQTVPLTKKKVEYPINPNTKKPYTKSEFFDVYNEFKDMAEKREEVFNIQVAEGYFAVELTGDLQLAPKHRNIPLKKKFV